MKINKKRPSDYLLYETTYNSEIQIEQIFVHYFDAFPSNNSNSTKKYSQKVLEYFLKKGYEKGFANGLAGGSFFVYQGTKRGVLISYPERDERVF